MANVNRMSRQESSEDRLQKETPGQFPLMKGNFIFMAVAAAMIVVGFLLMLGGSSTEAQFNPDIFSGRRIVVGPTVPSISASNQSIIFTSYYW